MRNSRTLPDSYEVRYRAAEIRKRWSPEERQLRIGLPPDTPLSMRQFILGNPKLNWQSAPANSGCSPRTYGVQNRRSIG
jgi:hypothetical protein